METVDVMGEHRAGLAAAEGLGDRWVVADRTPG